MTTGDKGKLFILLIPLFTLTLLNKIALNNAHVFTSLHENLSSNIQDKSTELSFLSLDIPVALTEQQALHLSRSRLGMVTIPLTVKTNFVKIGCNSHSKLIDCICCFRETGIGNRSILAIKEHNLSGNYPGAHYPERTTSVQCL